MMPDMVLWNGFFLKVRQFELLKELKTLKILKKKKKTSKVLGIINKHTLNFVFLASTLKFIIHFVT